MDHRTRIRTAFFLPFLLTLLAGPAWAAPSGKGSHYPGRECSECHKVEGKQDGNAPARSPAGSAPGTGSAGTPSGTTPSKGAPRTR